MEWRTAAWAYHSFQLLVLMFCQLFMRPLLNLLDGHESFVGIDTNYLWWYDFTHCVLILFCKCFAKLPGHIDLDGIADVFLLLGLVSDQSRNADR